MVASELVKPDGIVHPLDENGRETLVPSAEDAATLPLLPCSITEFPVGTDGTFSETTSASLNTPPQPGLYCFSILYSSASASTLTDCTLTIQ